MDNDIFGQILPHNLEVEDLRNFSFLFIVGDDFYHSITPEHETALFLGK